MLLLDASVWVSLVDPADRFQSSAEQIVVESSDPIAALDLTLYEIANAVGAKRRDADGARKLARVVSARCRNRLVRIDADLLGSTVELAAEHGLTAYDASYVAVARRNSWQLVSADIRDLVSKGLAVAPDAALYP